MSLREWLTRQGERWVCDSGQPGWWQAWGWEIQGGLR